MQPEKPYPYVDRLLARRLERAEAKTNAAFADARRAMDTASGATWIEVGGTYALYDGPKSPLTQTFGLGMHQTPHDEQFEAIEKFYASRGAPVFHEVCPVAEPSTLDLLTKRGYRAIEWSQVLYRPAAVIESTGGQTVQTRVVTPDEMNDWTEVSASGWSERPDLAEFMRGIARVVLRSRGTVAFLAEMEGRIVATGALNVHEGLPLLAGASTLPEARQLGAQRALLEARSRHAVENGCDLLMMVAHPGSTSQRNGERQ